ncbi:MAG: DUF4189 domain-containing protein [Oscillatoriales cyanobacterium SM2_1_8]|nr:DUF4189 domain-containing protein [Oscillatoriales cyanobacterium SM2_1_8]
MVKPIRMLLLGLLMTGWGTMAAYARYGAIARAANPESRAKGYAWNYESRDGAEKRALQECERTAGVGNCRVLVWAENACLAIAESSVGAAGTGWASTLDRAEAHARIQCQGLGTGECAIARSFCLPYFER